MNLAPHVTRIGHGTARAAHAFWDDIPAKERLARLAALTVVCWIVGGVVLAERRALWVLLAAWCLTAWVAGRVDEQPTEGEQDDEEQPYPDPADMADIVRELGEGTGVLLTRLAAQLHEEYPGTGWTTKDVRGLLAAAGVRVREGVRVTGVGNGPGVHRDDVPPPPSPTTPPPPVGVVVAGQDANTNTNNVRVESHAGGARITVTPARQEAH
ncbi:hypothetical protein [Streptomyces sp. CB00072]|uniref:hypothetical protein n=1 Tax=Streptomyces sp. CB00072 TaxID=1703928 RepID=UPI00093B7E6D|nr:hypothetical protein [Streptomyces sp. CB00072]